MKKTPKSEKKAGGQSKKHTGIISTNKRGVGYVELPEFEEDVEIPYDSLNKALNGDEVEIVLYPKIEGERQKGKVINILSKADRSFIGRIDKTKGGVFVIPDNRRMYTDIFLPSHESKKVRSGDKVMVEIKSWEGSSKNPLGKLVKVFGKAGDHQAEMDSIIAGSNIEKDFPAKVLKESEKIAKDAVEQIKNFTPSKERKDFRGAKTFTIDPEDAKDFDDALSIKEISKGRFEIGIHIADVSHYVKEGGILDEEARDRVFSAYLVDRTIPMLPEELSNNICSLRPNEDRFVFSAVFELDKDANVLEEWYGKGVINSDKRFSYEEAQGILDGKGGEFKNELEIINGLAKKLKEKRVQEGAIEFEQDEVKFKLDKKGRPIEIIKKERQDTNKLIEEFMLLANRRVAHFINKKTDGKGTSVFIYRIHDKPDPQKIEDLGIFLKALGFDFGSLKGKVTSKDIQKLLEQVQGTELQGLIETSAIRSMAKAVYSVKNIGHFGLGFAYYTHFTSPIRRYPDLLVHRLLEKILKGQSLPAEAYSHYSKIAKDASEREIEVAEAERESIKFKQAEYMKERIGQEFDAQIVGIVDFGIFVQTIDTLSEGLISVTKLSDDYYTLEKEKFLLSGKETGKKFRLGDKIRVRVTSADPAKKLIDFEIA